MFKFTGYTLFHSSQIGTEHHINIRTISYHIKDQKFALNFLRE